MKTKLLAALLVGFVIGAGTFFLVPPAQDAEAQGQRLWGARTAKCVLKHTKRSGSGVVILKACRVLFQNG